MIKRIVPVSYWSESDVLENYSLEDRLFHVYLMTNQYSSQLGIYKLNKCYMVLETGLDRKTVELLLDRFENTYKVIAYNHDTQEISLLKSLEYSIIRGGKPVLDLLIKEFAQVKDAEIILRTYQAMLPYWENSKRNFDQRIEELFYSELAGRQVNGFYQSESNQNDNHNHKYNENQNHNHNHNQISSHDSDDDTLIDKSTPKDWQENIDDKSMTVLTYYQNTIGDISFDQFSRLAYYLDTMSTQVIVESIERSAKASNPFKYCLKILKNWHQKDVQIIDDISAIDQNFQNKYSYKIDTSNKSNGIVPDWLKNY